MAQPDPPSAASLPNADDAAMLAAVHAGSTQAFDRLVERHKAPLLGYIRYRIGDAHAAEDLLQETFLRAFRAALRGSFEGRSTVKTWLFALATNCITDYQRSNARHHAMHGDANAPTAAHDPPSPGPDPAEAALLAEEHRRLHGVLDRLPDEQREVVQLKVFGGLTFGEIAEVAGCPVATAKSRMRYALRHIRELLEQETDNAQ